MSVFKGMAQTRRCQRCIRRIEAEKKVSGVTKMGSLGIYMMFVRSPGFSCANCDATCRRIPEQQFSSFFRNETESDGESDVGGVEWSWTDFPRHNSNAASVGWKYVIRCISEPSDGLSRVGAAGGLQLAENEFASGSWPRYLEGAVQSCTFQNLSALGLQEWRGTVLAAWSKPKYSLPR